MKYNEDVVRNSLAENLDLLEKNLVLDDTEVTIPAMQGASGRIDILARDAFGNRVIIEVKIADGAARSGPAELLKYGTLLIHQHRIPVDQIRCIIASTTWHELRSPIAKLAECAPFPIEGFQLHVDEGGTVTGADKVTLTLNSASALKFRRIQYLLCFGDTKHRTRVAQTVLKNAATMRLGMAAFEFDRDPVPPPQSSHLLAIVLAELSNDHYEAHPSWLPDPSVGPDDPWTFDDRLSWALFQDIDGLELEHCSPEKLLQVVQAWTLKGVCRSDDLAVTQLYSDSDLVDLACWRDRGNRVSFVSTCRPRPGGRWDNSMKGMRRLLGAGHPWFSMLDLLLGGVAKSHIDAIVTMEIYEPMNIFATIESILHGSTVAPHAVVTLQGGGSTLWLEAFLEWNGVMPSADMPLSVPFPYHWDVKWGSHMAAMEVLGLRYTLVETRDDGDGARAFRLAITSGKVERTPLPAVPLSIFDCVRSNPDRIRSIFACTKVFALP